jgi:hypothetical protein
MKRCQPQGSWLGIFLGDQFMHQFMHQFLVKSCFCAGRPPMLTDDPGTPGNGHWEINIASQLTTVDGSQLNTIQAPYFDINYGLGEHTQLKVETGWITSTGNESGAKSGGDIVLTGVKYRFLDEETFGASVATYPQFQFHSFYTTDDPQLIDPGQQFFLPIEVSKTLGNWEINPEVGYLYTSTTAVPRELVSGIVLAFEKAKPFEPLFEIHAITNLDGSGTQTLFNGGLRYTLNAQMNLIASLGRTAKNFVNQNNQLEAYLGIQLEL